jgi:hypothetical protein
LKRCCLLSRNTGFPAGVVADDRGVNATSAPKSKTECHFFVKTVVTVSKPHKHGLFAPFGLDLTRSDYVCSVVQKNGFRAKRYRTTPASG